MNTYNFKLFIYFNTIKYKDYLISKVNLINVYLDHQLLYKKQNTHTFEQKRKIEI
jgi:hypothetical protein